MYEVQKKREMHSWFWWDNLKERNHLEKLSVDERIVMKWMSKK
jgi:hypothetical protein